jgi:hypothetical protein
MDRMGEWEAKKLGGGSGGGRLSFGQDDRIFRMDRMDRMDRMGNGRLRSSGAEVAEGGFLLDRMTGFSGWTGWGNGRLRSAGAVVAELAFVVKFG